MTSKWNVCSRNHPCWETPWAWCTSSSRTALQRSSWRWRGASPWSWFEGSSKPHTPLRHGLAPQAEYLHTKLLLKLPCCLHAWVSNFHSTNFHSGVSKHGGHLCGEWDNKREVQLCKRGKESGLSWNVLFLFWRTSWLLERRPSPSPQEWLLKSFLPFWWVVSLHFSLSIVELKVVCCFSAPSSWHGKSAATRSWEAVWVHSLLRNCTRV